MSTFQRAGVVTRDPELMAETMRAAFGNIALSVIDAKGPAFLMNVAVASSVALLRVDLGFDGRGTIDQRMAPPEGQTYAVGQIYGGHVRMSSRREQVDTTHPFLYPELVEAEYSASGTRVISISRSLVQEQARKLAGNEALELRFTGWSPMSRSLDAHWRGMHAYAASVAELSLEEAQGSILHDQLALLLASSLLTCFPNNLHEHLQDHPGSSSPSPAAVRRALAFIEEHAGEPIGLAEIAAASRLSARGLQSAFQRELGRSPMQHLRRVRLDSVRRDLQSADVASGATVAAVARRWGFGHLGRFAQTYRSAFGETPSNTLKQ